MGIWNFVVYLVGVIVCVILLVILYETINTFIMKRKTDKMYKDAVKMFQKELETKIKKELDKAFEKNSK